MRTAFINKLLELAAGDPRINLLTGDLGFTVFEPFIARFPKRFINAGVAEQNMTGVAVGMALSGKIVFTYSIGNFPTLRCLEQIRNDACYHRANVKIVTVGGGIAYGPLGSSHHALEDFAILRALPNIVVAAPGDPVEAAAVTEALAYHEGTCYLRLGKAGEPVVHEAPIRFQLGRALTVREGTDITLLSTGSVLKMCDAAAEILSVRGLSVRLLSMPTIKPLDEEAVRAAVAETRALMTVEEHSVIGGLGSAVADVLAQEGNGRPFFILGTSDSFCKTVGSQTYLRKEFGLTAENIAANAQQLLER